jgi:hypothetical protein
LEWLRRIATTAAATAIGIVNVAMHRHESIVELKTSARFLVAGIRRPRLPSKGSGHLDIDKKISAASHGGDTVARLIDLTS